MNSLLVSLYSRLVTHTRDLPCSTPLDKLIHSALDHDLAIEELNHYSKIDNNLILNDKSALKTLNYDKIIGSDLSQGFQYYRPSPNEEIYQLNDLFQVLNQIPGSEVPRIVSIRRNLMILMLIPLTEQECEFNVIYKDNDIIIDYKWDETTTNDTLVAYSGFKFEELMTNNQSDDSTYYTVINQTINDLNILITAEIDSQSNGDYIELKTHNYKSSPSKLAKKLLVSWCQTRLINSNKIIVGFRSASSSGRFKLRSIKHYNDNDIPKLLCRKEYRIPFQDSYITCQGLLKWYKTVMKWIQMQIIDKKNQGDKNGAFNLKYSKTHQSLLLNTTSTDIAESLLRNICT